MTIEFSCNACGKVLKTDESRAGQRGKCPDCGEPIRVPAAPASDEFDLGEDLPPRVSGSAGLPPRVGKGGSSQTKTCPMCGASIDAGAKRCDACGESLGGGGRTFGIPGRLSVGAAMDQGWSRFKENMGPAILGMVVVWGIGFLGGLVLQFMMSAVLGGGMMMGRGNPFAAGGVAILGIFVAYIIFYCFSLWLSLGMSRFYLRIARHNKAEMGDIFAGENTKYILRMIGNGLAFGLVVGLLAALCMVLAAVLGAVAGPLSLIGLALYFCVIFWGSMIGWILPYVLIDRDPPGLGTLTQAIELMKGNLLSVFLLFLLVVVINFLGALCLLIGLIFTIPLSLVMLASAYDQISGAGSAADY